MTYEFSSSEDAVIHGVGIRGVIIGTVLLAIAIVDFVKLFQLGIEADLQTVLTVIQDIFLVLIALAFILPFYNYRNIAKTEGKDIELLMSGISRMKMGFIIIASVLALSVITEVIRLIWG